MTLAWGIFRSKASLSCTRLTSLTDDFLNAKGPVIVDSGLKVLSCILRPHPPVGDLKSHLELQSFLIIIIFFESLLSSFRIHRLNTANTSSVTTCPHSAYRLKSSLAQASCRHLQPRAHRSPQTCGNLRQLQVARAAKSQAKADSGIALSPHAVVLWSLL